MSSSECEVCCEKFNKTNRAPVVCCCDFAACRSCVKTYLLDQIQDPSCMSCKVQYTRKFMVESFEKSWVNKTYKNYREAVLLEREISMLPATQEHVEKEIRTEKLKIEIRKLEKEIASLINNKRLLQQQLDRELNTVTAERREFVRQCPNGECRGFLSSSLKCNLCEMWACGDCREVKGDARDSDHTCNIEVLESVKMLEKDTKPCPNCSALIFKVSGCSQMWCTQCHTTFTWNTGRIETGVIHNPEYFEYIRQTQGNVPRAQGDIQCGRELDHVFVVRNQLPTNLTNIVRNVIHIREIELIRFETNRNDNLQLRIDYMRQKIDKNKFMVRVQRREKERQKKIEVSNVLNMYIQCMTDIFYRYVETPSQDIADEMIGLQKYTNECFVNISKSYNCKQLKIDDKYSLN